MWMILWAECCVFHLILIFISLLSVHDKICSPATRLRVVWTELCRVWAEMRVGKRLLGGGMHEGNGRVLLSFVDDVGKRSFYHTCENFSCGEER